MNESVLIVRAEKFLDGIRHKEIDTDNISDFKSFIEVYNYLTGNIDELQEFRETMEMKGYKTPYRALLKYGRGHAGDIRVEDMHDVTRHSQYFRMRASAKKNIIDRVKSSIASHKIAIGHLEESAMISCKSCGKRFRGHEISYIKSGRCICGFKDFEFHKNMEGVFRLDIIQYLPLSGEYMVRMSKLSPLGREAFRKIVRILKHQKRGIVKTVTLVVKALEDGRWVHKRVNIDVHEDINYERVIQKKYGSNARIEFLQFHRRRPAIINDKHVQTALSLAYVKFAEKFLSGIFDELLNQHLQNKKKMKIYDAALKTADEIAAQTKSHIKSREQIKEEKLSEILIDSHLMDEEGIMDEELKYDIQTKKNLEKSLSIEIPRTLILWDIIKYYLTTSYDRRSKYSGPFPNLRPNLDTGQLKAFEDFDELGIKILKGYGHEKIEYIPNIKEVIAKKFEIENKMKGLHIKMDSPAVGAAILNITDKLSIEKSADLFSVDPEEIKREKHKIETIGKPTSKKAKKFLEMIKS